MTNCEEYREKLADRYMNRLEAGEAAELEQHLSSCPGCREALAATSFVLDHLNNLQDPAPSAHMKTDFRAMLDEFKSREKKPVARLSIWTWLFQPRLSLGYGLIVLLCIAGAYWFGKSNLQGPQVREVQAQAHNPKQIMMLVMLNDPLASQRLKAVSYTGEMKRVDKRVTDALLATLNNDPNDNVRLSTLEALAQLAGNPEVRLGLIQSIAKQDSPVIQLAIADVMLKLQEKRSVDSFKQLLKQKGLDNEVRNKVK